MGQRKARKQRFLEKHPICCFCGCRPSETEDHIPSRDFFIDRKWPEGYVFPACRSCNNNSSNLEQVVAFYQNAMNFDNSQFSNNDTDQRIEALLNNAPEVFPKAVFSPSKRRKVIRDLGIKMGPGETTQDYPVIAIDNTLHIAFHVFYSKLICALYYKHLEKIVPDSHYYTGQWEQYRSRHGQERVRAFNELMEHTADLTRGKKELYDQFQYTYWIGTETQSFSMVAQFRKSFFILGGAVAEFYGRQGERWLPCDTLPFR